MHVKRAGKKSEKCPVKIVEAVFVPGHYFYRMSKLYHFGYSLKLIDKLSNESSEASCETREMCCTRDLESYAYRWRHYFSVIISTRLAKFPLVRFILPHTYTYTRTPIVLFWR